MSANTDVNANSDDSSVCRNSRVTHLPKWFVRGMHASIVYVCTVVILYHITSIVYVHTYVCIHYIVLQSHVCCNKEILYTSKN